MGVGVRARVTVSVVLPSTPSSLALIRVVPTAKPVVLPALSGVRATLVFPLPHVAVAVRSAVELSE